MSEAIANQLFLVYLGRPADVAWRKSTADLLNSAAPPVALQNAFFSAAVLEGVYSLNDSPSALVNKIFQNIFGFGANGFEQQQWGDLITKGVITAQTAAWTIFNSYLGATNLGALSDTYQVPARSKLIAVDAYTTELGNNGAANVAVSQVGGAAAASARTVIAGVTSIETAAPVVNGIATTVNTAATSATGSTFTLTTGSETITGTAGNDTFNAAGVSAALSSFDSLDGGAGTDSLSALIALTALPGSLTVKNIETATINTTGGGFVDDFTGWTGLTNLTVNAAATGAVSVTVASTTGVTAVANSAAITVIGGGGAATLTVNSTSAAGGGDNVTVGGTAVANNYSKISVVGGDVIALTDRSGASAATGATLTSVSISGAVGDQTITSNGLTSLALTKLVGASGVGDTEITSTAGARALTITYNGVDVAGDGAVTGTDSLKVTDTEATSLNLIATGAASYDVKTVTAKAAAVTIAAGVNFSMADLVGADTVTKTVGISGAGKTTITASTLDAAVVITSTSTGGVTLTQALTANQQYVGSASSGVDTIGVATGFTKAITTGAGNDVVTYGGPASGGTIDAGDGTDTISMTAAIAATATASSTFAGTVSGFEVLSIGAYTDAAVTVNMTNADGINSVVSAGGGTATAARAQAISGFLTGGSFTQTARLAADQNVTLSGAGFAAGTDDAFNLVFKGANGYVNDGSLTLASIETLKITTDDTDTTAATTAFDANLDSTSVKSVTIDGDAGITFANSDLGTALTKFDASAVTVGTVTYTTGALAASSTIIGSATAANVITFSAANTASTFVTYTGSSGADTVVGSNDLNNVVNLGNGANSYTQAGAGNFKVTGGSGVDTITIGTGSATVDVGGGATNTVATGAVMNGLNVITFGSGVDTFDVNHVSSAAGRYPSIIGIAAGDKIDLVGISAGTIANKATLGAAVTLGAASNFANFLDAANASNAGGTNALVNWFQFNGNTYIAVDNSNNTTYADSVDLVIELAGLVNLTNSTLTSEVITLV